MPNRVLFLGAGFSASLRALLANEVSDMLFNSRELRQYGRLKSLEENNFDYEAIYQKVMQTEAYSQKEQQAFTQALQQAYQIIDKRIISNNSLSQAYCDLFKEFLFQFSNTNEGSGFIFTLNQDVLFERRYLHYPGGMSTVELPIIGTNIPGLQWQKSISDSPNRELPTDITKKKLQYEDKVKKRNIELSYIKLHGSLDWYTNDKRSMMIIGHGKSESLNQNPLLSWYFELFQKQLNQPDTKLFIVGYSFKDEHINKVIAKTDNPIKIYINNCTRREDFTKDLKTKKYGNKIIKRIEAYYRSTLLDIFPSDTSKRKHHDWREILKNYFDLPDRAVAALKN